MEFCSVYTAKYKVNKGEKLIGYKDRPVLFIKDSNVSGYCIVMKITTQNHKNHIFLTGWQEEGLAKPSYVEVDKIVLIPKDYLKKYIGALTKEDMKTIGDSVKELKADGKSFRKDIVSSLECDVSELDDVLVEQINFIESVTPPKKVGKAYKVFRVKDGKLYPPMVANLGGKDTPIGMWLEAEEGEFAGLSKTGRPQVKSTGSGTLSYRPGWHLGDVPRAPQFDRTNKETGELEFPKDFVWAECDYAMDIDYQPESDEQGYMRTKVDKDGNITTYRSDKYQHSLAGLPRLPKDGYYKYRTNPRPDTVPWVITGKMKVNRLLSDDEVNDILKSKGIAPIHRQGGDKTLKELGLQESLNKQDAIEEGTSGISPRQAYQNLKKRKEFASKASGLGFDTVIDAKDLTVHHINNLDKDDELKYNSFDNLWFIKSANFRDRETLHKLLHYMERNNISYNELLDRLEDIKIYKFDDTTNTFVSKTLSTFKESLSKCLKESVLPTTPYMLRDDGKLLTCGENHPYVKFYQSKSDKENLDDLLNKHKHFLTWFKENTLNEKAKKLINVLLNKKGSEEDLISAMNELNDLMNQEFCRVRTSNYKYKYGGDNGEIYFRISSKNINWYDLIWKVVNDLKKSSNIKDITIMSDYQTTGEKFKYATIKGEEVNHMPVDEFLTMSGNPVVESYLTESKEDIQKFVDKFGEDTYNNFIKARDRLKNKGYSTDILYYVKNTSPEELKKLLVSLYDKEKDQQKARQIQGTDKDIRGKYNYLGEKGGYKVYEPLDVQASMDLGVNTGWCTTGRYGHYGHPEFTPSKREASRHWNNYKDKGIRFFYFLDPVTMYGKYAVALYPRILTVNGNYGKRKLKQTNIEVYNAEDNLDFDVVYDNKLPLDILPERVVVDSAEITTFEIENNTLNKYNGKDTKVVIPDSVTSIGNYAFYNCKYLESVKIPDGVISIGGYAFYACNSLTSITIPNSVTYIRDGAFSYCTSLTSIEIPYRITSIAEGTFKGCSSLTNIKIPDSITNIGDFAFSYCGSLANIEIPNSVTHIGDSAFLGCYNLVVSTNSRYVQYYCKSRKIPCHYEENESLNESLVVEEIEKHDTLNPKLFNDDNKLKKDVSTKVKEIVDEFISMLEEDKIKIKVNDIILVGSNASYNYNDNSDLDVHIEVDTSSLDCPDDLYPLLYSAYRSIFNKKYDIDFYGIPVEIFVDVDGALPVSNGIYSVVQDKWLKEPVQQDIPDIDMEEFDKEFKKWEDKYFELVSKNNLEESVKLQEIYPNKGEKKKDFIARFMSVTKDEYPDEKQRYAVALSYWDRRNKR